jgi:transposase
VRDDAAIKRWYRNKSANTLTVVADEAVANKLTRACWHVMKDGQFFDASRALA